MKKLYVVFFLLFFTVFSAKALPLVPKLGMQLEVRGGGYLTVSPDEAKNMFDKGVLVGVSLRKSIIPMFKLGIGFDYITLNKDAVSKMKMSSEMQTIVDAASDADFEYKMVPIYLEATFEPPIIPFYVMAGVGTYRSSIKVTVSGNEIYNKSESKMGGFVGAGVKLGLPLLPISFRAGAKYHILKVDKDVMSDNIKAISLEAAVRLNF